MPPSAALTEPRRNEPTAARPPTVRPDRRRNARRSMASEARPAARACSLPFAASPLLRLISIGQPSLLERLVSIGPVESLDVIALAITAFGFFLARVVGLRLGRGDRRGDGRNGRRRGASDRAEEIAAIHGLGLVLFHLTLRADHASAL